MDNESEIKRYMDIKLINGQSEITINLQTRILKQLSEFLNKPFKDVIEDNIISFMTERKKVLSPSTMNLTKIVIKSFYRYLYGMKKHEYPTQVVNLNGTNSNKKKLPIRPEDVITKEDVANLVKYCRYYRGEAMVVTLYETACRLGEFTNIDLDHLLYDKYGIVLLVDGKTGQRRIRLVESVPYIQRWVENHPMKDEKDYPQSIPLWCTLRPPYKRLKLNTIQCLFIQLKKRSGIQKPLNPHNFRHSRLTEMSKFLSDAKMKIFAGWTGSSRMVGIYEHLSGKDIDDDLLRIAGVEIKKEELTVSPLRQVECLRCKAKNPITNTFCGLCGLVLNEQKVLTKELDTQTEFEDLKEKYVVAVDGIEGMMDEISKLRKDIAEIKSQK